MNNKNTKSVGDREEWIRHLLYTPDETGASKPIYGRTRVMKACFLLDRKLEERIGKSTNFEFIAHKYGPFDKGVYEALEQLEEANHIDIVPESKLPSNEGRKYELTPRGKRKAEESYMHLTDRERELLKWVKHRQAERPLGTLLSYVYSNYPTYTTESELV